MLPLLSKNKEKIYSFFVYFIVFLSSVFPYSDKDWGWHFKYGQYFFTHGQLLVKDIFSWTMPGYQWVNSSWLFDPLLYILTKTVGYVGLSLISAFLVLLTFYFLTAAFKLNYWKKAILAAFFLLMSEAGIGYGLRSQVISTTFFSLVMFILMMAKKKTKLIYLLPVIFTIWVNFHIGDFFIALGVMGIFLGYYFLIDWYESKKFNTKLFITYAVTSILTFLGTFINPFTYKIYFETFRYLNNPYLKNVFEWDPIFPQCPYCHPYTYFIYLIIIAVIVILYLKRKNFFAIPFLILAVIFAWPTFETRRLLPLFAILTLPLFADFLKKIKFDLGKYKSVNYFAIAIIIICVSFNLYNRFSSYDLYNYTEADFCSFSSSCSVASINYLVAHPPKGRGFNFYDWGGYMIGRGVPAKLFIDGRMHLWKNSNGYTAFGDYISMYYNGNYSLFNKYNFDWIFLPTNAPIWTKIQNSKDLGEWKVNYLDSQAVYLTRVR